MANTTITPNAGKLRITSSLIATAVAGSMAFQGFAPSISVITPTVLTPNAGSLRITNPNQIIQPGSGSLSLVGNVPGAVQGGGINTILTPSSGILRITTPKVSMTITPNPGVLGFAGQIPVQLLTLPSVTPGALALSGLAPVMSINFILTPNAGALSLFGSSPSVGIAPGLIMPFPGTALLIGSAPILTVGTPFVPDAGALAFQGFAPTISVTQNKLQPSAGALALQGFAPSITIFYTVTPPAASLAFTGHAPIVRQDSFIQPNAGALSMAGQTPSVSTPAKIIGNSGILGLVGFAPTLFIRGFIAPSAGTAALSGHAPSISISQVLTPNAGALTLLGLTPRLLSPISPNPAALSFVGQRPTVMETFQLTPNAGVLAVQGLAPTAVSNRSVVGLYEFDPEFVDAVSRGVLLELMPTTYRFPVIGPTEDRVLTFDFTSDLDPGETLAGIIGVTVAVTAGIDPNPTTIFDGIASYDNTLMQVQQPVRGQGVIDTDYYIVVTAPTTNPFKILARYGLLQVRA